jgi:hemoglobin
VVKRRLGDGPSCDRLLRSALEDVGIADPLLRRVLHGHFEWATTTSMAAYPRKATDVPDGLRIPRWSRSGLQE